MEHEEAVLDLIELLLTAEIYNTTELLGINDLTPRARLLFGITDPEDERTQVIITESAIERILQIPKAHLYLENHPLVLFEEFGHRLTLTTPKTGFSWLTKHGGADRIETNPVLAYYAEQNELATKGTYTSALEQNPKYEDSRQYLNKRLKAIIESDEKLNEALDLVILYAPEEIEYQVEDIICSDEQNDRLVKMKAAFEHIPFLASHNVTEIGKFLFIGPPGTGKTSLAHVLARTFHMCLLEVRLSMITSQYLGETSKNIDRVFELAQKLSPCILFIDEFDFLAKSRTGDDHGAMKRAVNALLKNVDRISLVRNNVILIGATNHPKLLDAAAWRRFDEIIPFELPGITMREQILKRMLGRFECLCDPLHIAQMTEGYSGADLRMVVREAVLSALIDGRTSIQEEDLLRGILFISDRGSNKERGLSCE